MQQIRDGRTACQGDRDPGVVQVMSVAMQRTKRAFGPLAALVVLAAMLSACSSDLSLNNVTLVPKPETIMRKPDWATFSGGKNDFELRPITAADLVGPDGQCSAAPEQRVADSATAGGGPAAPVTGGIALQMTECDVVRRAGPVEKVDFGVNDRGERAVVLTYTHGLWPGVYNFVGGRLASIERVPGPPPAPPAPTKSPKATTKKPAGT